MVRSSGLRKPSLRSGPRVGGKLRIVMRAPDGAEHPMIGEFREIKPPERLVFTSIATDCFGTVLLDGLTTVTLAEHGDGHTRLTVESRAVARVDYASRMLEGMGTGWTQSIDRLGDLLAKTRPAL